MITKFRRTVSSNDPKSLPTFSIPVKLYIWSPIHNHPTASRVKVEAKEGLTSPNIDKFTVRVGNAVYLCPIASALVSTCQSKCLLNAVFWAVCGRGCGSMQERRVVRYKWPVIHRRLSTMPPQTRKRTNEWVLEKADTERSTGVNSIHETKFFGHVTQKPGTCLENKTWNIPRREQEYEEDHAQLGKTTSRHGQGYRCWKEWGQRRTVHNGGRLSMMQPNLVPRRGQLNNRLLSIDPRERFPETFYSPAARQPEPAAS